MPDDLPWSKPFRAQCRAVREPRGTDAFFGRCELRPDHTGHDHALDRGMDTPRWSTDWTA